MALKFKLLLAEPLAANAKGEQLRVRLYPAEVKGNAASPVSTQERA